MKNFLIHTALAAIVGLGSLSFAPMRANAQDLELNLGGNGPTIRLRDNCDPDREDCRDMRRGDRHDGRRNSFQRQRFCTEDRALDKAERMGIRRARIDSVGRRSIDVRGRDRRGDRVEISFGRAPNCPVIG
jgi:hypothetical protein